MEFTGDLKALAQAVGVANRGVSNRGTLPILAHVLVEADAEGVRITGTDLALRVSAAVPGAAVQVGAVCVPGRVLGELLGAMPGQAVTVQYVEPHLVLRTEHTSYSLHVLPATSFPDFPAVEGATVALAGRELLMLCRRAGFCASEGDGKPVLESMLLMSDGAGRLAAASTDTHRLAVFTLTTEAPAFSAIIPARVVSEVLKLVDEPTEVSLTFGLAGDTPVMRLVCEGVDLQARLIQGRFPDWERVIPQDVPTRCRCDRKGVLGALTRAAVVARTSSSKVILASELGAVVITTPDSKDVGSAREEVPAEVTEWRAAFNVTYLVEALEASQAETVTICQGEAMQPAVITDETDGWASVVMPMQML